MSGAPTISVLMPVYNAERYVAEAVESILNQTLGDFEFLIIDDGSTDRSLKILQRYAVEDSRIKLISRPNTGYVVALNELLALARGEFIARMDADDVALPQRFAQQVALLRREPAVVCVGGAQDKIDEAGRVLIHHQDPLHDAEIQRMALCGKVPINHPSATIRREAVLRVGGYDESLCPSEDLDLWLRLGEIGKLANLPETVLKYRQHTNSVSEKRQAEQIRNWQVACEQAWLRRGMVGQFEACEAWRPVDRDSRHELTLQYGWMFFYRQQRSAAIAYGWRAVCLLPLNRSGWILLGCALLKPLPEPEALTTDSDCLPS